MSTPKSKRAATPSPAPSPSPKWTATTQTALIPLPPLPSLTLGRRQISSSDELARQRAASILSLTLSLRDGIRNKTHDRRWRNLKVYKNCFLHSDAIQWLMDYNDKCLLQQQQQEEGGNRGGRENELANQNGTTMSQNRNSNNNNNNKATASETARLEAIAVKQANEMIHAGYVSHVCNDHIFSVGETRVLYFHFHNGVIECDLQTLQSRTQQGNTIVKNKSGTMAREGENDSSQIEPGNQHYYHITSLTSPLLQQNDNTNNNPQQPLRDEISELQLKIDRLSRAVVSGTQFMSEAHGKIVFLETAIVSLAFVVAVIFALDVALFFILGIMEYYPHYLHTVKLLVVVLMGIVIAIYVSTSSGTSRPSSFSRRITEHGMLLAKLVSTNDLESTIMMTQDSEDEEESDEEEEEEDEEDDNKDAKSRKSKPHHKRRRRPRTRKHSRMVESMSRLSQSIGMISPPQDEKRKKPRTRGKKEEKDGIITMREACDIPHPSKWPHRPVLLCVNTPVSSHLKVSLSTSSEVNDALPLGVPFPFSSDLFEGKCLIRLRNVPSDDPNGDESYFIGRKRHFQSIIQGRFKQELRVCDVLTGHEFARPLKRLPPSWILRTGMSLIKRLAPGAEIDVDTDQPRAMSILAATSQVVSVDRPGNEPEITSNEIEEDVSLFGGVFSGGDVSISKRKRYLSDPDRAAKHTFDTESIYTFDFYQQLLDVGTYSLDLGFTKLDLAKTLDGQPIQVLSKTVDGRYLWSFQVWHEKLLPKKRKKGELSMKKLD